MYLPSKSMPIFCFWFPLNIGDPFVCAHRMFSFFVRCRPQLFVLVLAAMLGAAFTDEEETSARLLVAKMIMNKYLVEDMDIIVKYSLYNIGNSAALAVEVNDNSFNPDAFDVVGGQLRVSLDRIPPGANVSHVVVVRPRKYGYFNFTSAQVSYLPSEDAAEVRVNNVSILRYLRGDSLSIVLI